MKKYNISKPEKYTKDGMEKTAWKNVGEIVEFTRPDGTVSRILEIPAIGLKANVFPVEPKKVEEEKDPADLPPVKDMTVEEDINPDDIPF